MLVPLIQQTRFAFFQSMHMARRRIFETENRALSSPIGARAGELAPTIAMEMTERADPRPTLRAKSEPAEIAVDARDSHTRVN